VSQLINNARKCCEHIQDRREWAAHPNEAGCRARKENLSATKHRIKYATPRTPWCWVGVYVRQPHAGLLLLSEYIG